MPSKWQPWMLMTSPLLASNLSQYFPAPSRVCDAELALDMSLDMDVKAAAAVAMQSISKLGPMFHEADVEDIEALCAQVPCTEVVFVHNSPGETAFKDFEPILTVFFKEPGMSVHGGDVFMTICKTAALHKESSGFWRVGDAVGSGSTWLLSLAKGGITPPTKGWCNSAGEHVPEIMCLNPLIVASISLKTYVADQIGFDVRNSALRSTSASHAHATGAAGDAAGHEQVDSSDDPEGGDESCIHFNNPRHAKAFYKSEAKQQTLEWDAQQEELTKQQEAEQEDASQQDKVAPSWKRPIPKWDGYDGAHDWGQLVGAVGLDHVALMRKFPKQA